MTSLTVSTTASLSAQLRAGTASLHRQIETLAGLPGTIRSRDDYVAWLSRFLGLYEPLERSLAVHAGWDALGLVLRNRSHSAALADDLAALGTEAGTVARVPAALLPALPTFAHALGTLYVLEGATLGGSVILRDLQPRLGDSIGGATGFFGGRGDAVGPMWHSFRAALDGFGHDRPLLRADVLTGAERGFRALLAWFAPFRLSAGALP